MSVANQSRGTPRLFFNTTQAVLTLGIIVTLPLAGCASLTSWSAAARSSAAAAGFVELPEAGVVRSFLRPGQAVTPWLTVYIEGDGAAWISPNLPPRDPTPRNPLALKLAIADARQHPDASVAYLGRPCQYLEPGALKQCNENLWRTARFGEDALREMQSAIDRLQKQNGARRIALVGYSGGGALAALLTAQRDDVGCLVTIAAPLDIAAWAAHMGVSALTESINPLQVAGQLQQHTQTHLLGAEDHVVPPATSRSFLTHLPPGSSHILPGFGHDAPWLARWPDLLGQTCLATRETDGQPR